MLDTTEKGYGATKVRGREQEISPAHHVEAGAPPTIVFHGTKDTTVPFENAERFTAEMKKADNHCELVSFPDQKHGFFNKEPYKTETLKGAEKLVISLGWLAAEAAVK